MNRVMRLAAAALALSIACPALVGAQEALGGLARRDNRPLEQLDGVEQRYESVVAPNGQRLRAIVSRPAGAASRLPGLFVVGWLSCDSVESPPKAQVGDGTGMLLQSLARQSGHVLLRLDKPGVGDSEGRCEDTDFDTELAAYRAAYREFLRSPWVQPDRVIILGLSNGGGFAPLVPNGRPVAGYISSGGWVKTWLEHMLDIERRRLAFSDLAPGLVNERMRGTAELYQIYLNERRLPSDVVKDRPHLAHLWEDGPGHQYGRPAAFYHQLQGLNLLAAWETVDVPVLALWGEYDWIMSRHDVELIVETANRRTPGRARFVEIPRMGHSHDVFTSKEDAFRFRNPGWDPAVVTAMVDWLRGLGS